MRIGKRKPKTQGNQAAATTSSGKRGSPAVRSGRLPACDLTARYGPAMNIHYGAASKTKPIEATDTTTLRGRIRLFVSYYCLFFNREVFLSYATKRANPIFGQVFKGCSGSYAVIRIAYFRVIYITTSLTNILFHNLDPFNC